MPARRMTLAASRSATAAKPRAARQRRAKPHPEKARASKPRPATPRATTPRAPRPATRAAAVRALERSCDSLLAAIRAMPAAAAERPIAPGKWTPKQVLLHLAYWDEWMLGVLPAAITRGRNAEPLTGERVEAANSEAVRAGAHLSWDEVRTL